MAQDTDTEENTGWVSHSPADYTMFGDLLPIGSGADLHPKLDLMHFELKIWHFRELRRIGHVKWCGILHRELFMHLKKTWNSGFDRV